MTDAEAIRLHHSGWPGTADRRTGAFSQRYRLSGIATNGRTPSDRLDSQLQRPCKDRGKPRNRFCQRFTRGLVAWVVTIALVRRADPFRAQRAIALCATYWHFLLAVWLVLLAAMWWMTPAIVAAICGPLYGAAP